jgi:glycerol-3-phosphate O-acyltransferase/dihydroxyacetone phosphate acyltransferase
MRRFITSAFRLFLRIFFRRIDVSGQDRLPLDVPVVLAANHPNGLIDPLVLLCVAPREVSFLAKAPLFRYPVIGYFVRLFRSIPVYRKQDNTRGTNAETFAQAREVLKSRGSIAIFPEGTTHSDPMLRELKTGAARIALGAAIDRLVIVPVGIYYTDKQRFRSSVVVAYGRPIEVVPKDTDADGEPDREAVEALTQQIDDGLDRVTVQADSDAALDLIGRAEDIITADDDQSPRSEFALRRQFVRGYHYLRTSDPSRLQRLESQVTQLEAELTRAGLEAHDLTPRIRAVIVARLLVSLPLAAAGAVIHAPAYLIVHVLAHAAARREFEMTATYKALASLVLYPATWIALAVIARSWAGWPAAAAALVIAPLLFVFAVRIFEATDDLIGGARAIVYRTFRRRGHARLVEQRDALRDELLAIAREMES